MLLMFAYACRVVFDLILPHYFEKHMNIVLFIVNYLVKSNIIVLLCCIRIEGKLDLVLPQDMLQNALPISNLKGLI